MEQVLRECGCLPADLPLKRVSISITRTAWASHCSGRANGVSPAACPAARPVLHHRCARLRRDHLKAVGRLISLISTARRDNPDPRLDGYPRTRTRHPEKRVTEVLLYGIHASAEATPPTSKAIRSNDHRRRSRSCHWRASTGGNERLPVVVGGRSNVSVISVDARLCRWAKGTVRRSQRRSRGFKSHHLHSQSRRSASLRPFFSSKNCVCSESSVPFARHGVRELTFSSDPCGRRSLRGVRACTNDRRQMAGVPVQPGSSSSAPISVIALEARWAISRTSAAARGSVRSRAMH